ncbi:hypothetical protein OS493_033502 [Desmophyllum pertusum]|uniref:INTS8 TPR repeats domain-containing protein n=1 Tax=Desmophyllum pertusum TaxID=174260 RepID=A0A9W9Z912_9CNID|nr:hypothetical protein OS493_033502 [Desmophyllum pertusum]
MSQTKEETYKTKKHHFCYDMCQRPCVCQLADPVVSSKGFPEFSRYLVTTQDKQKRPADGSVAIQAEGLKLTNLIHFARKIKEETVLTVLLSCLVRTAPMPLTSVCLALSGVVHHALSVQQHNVSWLQTLGDIYLDSGNYSSALRCYLEAGAVSSFFFNSSVPSTVYRKMVTCCSAMKAHIQAALLCQCMEVKDYTTAFKALQQASSACSDAMRLLLFLLLRT